MIHDGILYTSRLVGTSVDDSSNDSEYRVSL